MAIKLELKDKYSGEWIVWGGKDHPRYFMTTRDAERAGQEAMMTPQAVGWSAYRVTPVNHDA